MAFDPVYEPTDYLFPFPDADSVFATDVSAHQKYLLPLTTLSLNRVNPEWSGNVHFVQPIEPYGGVIGEETTNYHTYLCRRNWIGFQLDRDDRYTFAADWQYFLASGLNSSNGANPSSSEEGLLQHYAAASKSYEKNRAHFKEHGALHASYARRRNGKYADSARQDLICQIGGVTGWGNWCGASDFPLSKTEVQSDEEVDYHFLPLAEDGSAFVFIGWLHAFSYVNGIDCNLYLFYHPQLRLVLETFDWS